MGREIKRVALDFDWPKGEVWNGFVNPHGGPCPEADKTCFGGATADLAWLSAILRFMETVANDGLRAGSPVRKDILQPHPYLREFPQQPQRKNPRELNEAEEHNRRRWGHDVRLLVAPTREFARFYSGLSGDEGKSMFGFGGGSGTYRLQKKLIELAGMPKEWGLCPVCGGDGDDPAQRAAAEAWKPTEPPAGEGWQVWETVSEGSPITPVFSTAEALIEHLVKHGDGWDRPVSREAAEAFVKGSGWVPSMIVGPEGVVAGVEIAGLNRKEDR